jgi:poly(A) polymerase
MTDPPARRIAVPDWLSRPEIRHLTDLLGEARFVGGAVRDTLLGRPIGDLDLATPLPPEEVLRRLGKAHIRAIPTGIDHGTVTAVLESGPVEITTLRRDVETDGRHAVVAFTADWAADAARRDFTMNALYLDAEGFVFDPVGGLSDCLSGRVHFVSDPAQRIREDVLRLWRFYRFLAHYGRTAPDAAARRACRELAPLTAGLAGERLKTELMKLLVAPDPVPALRMMIEDEVWATLLPAPGPLEALSALIHIEPAPDGLRRLAILLPAAADPGPVAERLRLANAERDRLAALVLTPAPDLGADARAQRRDLYRLGRELYRDLVLLAAARRGKPDAVPALLAAAAAWTDPVLPIGGAEVLAAGVPAGPRVGALLKAIEAWWIAGDFQAGRAACLAQLAALLAQAPETITRSPGPAVRR